jgi:hypothetical protein
MRRTLALLVAVMTVGTFPALASADEASDCSSAAGTLLTGVVVSPPRFKPASERKKGVYLSHTHVSLRSDTDNQVYDIAIDNVFAAGYDQAGKHIPSPLDQITQGTRLEVCGKPYSEGSGMDWVHTNCGETPTADKPDGWVKIFQENGSPGDNLESSTEYCRLWP